MATHEIPVNKTRLVVLTTILALALVAACSVAYSLWTDNRISPLLLIVTIAGIPVLLFMIIFIAKKISSNRPGLVIDGQGITDNLNLSTAGIIPWGNIVATTIVQHQQSYFILLGLKDNEAILKKLSGMKLTLAKNNIKIFNTPCAINASNLKIDRQELLHLLNKEIKARQ